MTARKHVVPPGEDDAGFNESRQLWFDDAAPTSVFQAALTDSACRASWKLQRSARSEDAAVAAKVQKALDRFEPDRRADAAARLRALTDDPLSRCDEPPTDPATVAAARDYYQADPARLRAELCLSVEGVDCLRARWSEIAGRLQDEGFLHYPDKFAMTRMLGLRPEESLDDPLVTRIHLACRALHPEAWAPDEDHAQARLGLENRPIYCRRVEFIEKQMPSKEEALDTLLGLMLNEVERLTELDEVLRPKREQERARVADAAMVEDAPAAALRIRYETAASRELHRSIAEFMKLRKAEEAPTEPGPTGSDEPRQDEPAAKTPEVVTEQIFKSWEPAPWPAGGPVRNEPSSVRPAARPVRPEDVRIVPDGPLSGGSRGPGGFKDPA